MLGALFSTTTLQGLSENSSAVFSAAAALACTLGLDALMSFGGMKVQSPQKGKTGTLQGTNISNLGKRKIIFKSALGWDMLISKRVKMIKNWAGPWPITTMCGFHFSYSLKKGPPRRRWEKIRILSKVWFFIHWLNASKNHVVSNMKSDLWSYFSLSELVGSFCWESFVGDNLEIKLVFFLKNSLALLNVRAPRCFFRASCV